MKHILIGLSSCMFICFSSPVMGKIGPSGPGLDFTVEYFCWDGSGTPPASQTVSSLGDSVIVADNTCIPPSGYVFSGWLYSMTNTIYQPGDSFSVNEPGMALKAQYEIGTMYTVSFVSGNGGTGSMSDLERVDGATVTLPANGFTTSSGYTFNGWNCDNGIGAKAVGATFTMPAADVACTAQWTGNTVNLTWYGDGGTTTLSGGASSCTYGGTISSLPTAPAKLGYHFARWKVVECKIPSDLVNSNSGYVDMYELGKLIYSGIGKVQFDRKCSNTNGTYATPGTPSDTNGRYCWCAATAWIPDGGNQCNISNPVWVFRYADENFSECETYCNMAECAWEAGSNSNFRSAVFGVSN